MPPRQVGFTLMEVITVLAVAGILMLIAVPRIDVERFQLDAAMREVGSAVAAARGRAILRQHDYVLMFAEPHRCAPWPRRRPRLAPRTTALATVPRTSRRFWKTPLPAAATETRT